MAVRGECVGEVGDGEREVVDRVRPLRAFAAAEARQLRRNDLEALGEQVEERCPRGGEFVVDEEQARAVPVAESGDADVGDVDGDLGWGHEGQSGEATGPKGTSMRVGASLEAMESRRAVSRAAGVSARIPRAP